MPMLQVNCPSLKSTERLAYLTLGTPQSDIDQLQNYEPQGLGETLQVFKVESGGAHAKHGLLCMLYDAFRAAGADGTLHAKELEAIFALGKTLGATEEELKQLHDVYNEEQQVRRKRLAIIFPQGSHVALTEVEKEY